MGIMDSITGTPQSRMGKGAYGLTPLGKQKAENWDSGGIQCQVLTALDEVGPATLSEIRDKLHQRNVPVSFSKIQLIVQSMIRAGYLQRVGPQATSMGLRQ